jgi:glycosyltransferase involved in cell wall biosynthesis
LTEPAVSIVIPARDATSTLPASLAACRAQEGAPSLEIVVVDNGSTDDTAAVAERMGARVIRQANSGPAAARNRGWREARAPVILFTDSDCVPHPDWVRLLAGAIDTGTPVAGGSYGIANPGCRLAEIVHAEIVWRHSRLGREVEYVGSFNFGVRREALESVGGFDAFYSEASGEDSDLCYRLRDAGHRIRFVPEALVDHYHPTSLARYGREQSRHGFWRVVLYGTHPRRVRGDGYAGPLDLVAPPLAALSGVVALSAVFVRLAGPIALVTFSLVFLLSTVLAARVALHARSIRVLSLAFVATLRAYARGWGMTRGVASLVLGRRPRGARS